MLYEILNGLLSEGRMGECSITIAHRISADGSMVLQGGLITGLSRAGIEYAGGEAGQETIRVPFKDVLEISTGFRKVYCKKSSIERIYPRH